MRFLRYSLLLSAALAFSVPCAFAQAAFTPGPTLDSPVGAPEHNGGVSITQNSDLSIQGGGVACANQTGGYTVENTYWRVFTLADFPEITEAFSVESVDIGINPTSSFSSDGLDTDLSLYKMEGGVNLATGTFSTNTLTLLSQETYHVAPTDPPGLYNVAFPDSPDLDMDDTLAVAWHTPDGSVTVPVTDIRYGYNSSGSTGTTYLQSTSCGATNPTDVAQLGAFGDLQWVVQVNGTLTPTATEGGPELSARVTLGQAAPNPFGAASTVTFTVHTPTDVRLAVYDALGREVAVLADGAYPAGAHTVSFDAAGLPSGTYLVRLSAGGTVLTRTTTLVR